jgi:hypothetical protein
MKGSSCPHNHLTCMRCHEFPSVWTTLNGVDSTHKPLCPPHRCHGPQSRTTQEYTAQPLCPPLHSHPPRCVSHPRHGPRRPFVIMMGHSVLCLEWLECCRLPGGLCCPCCLHPHWPNQPMTQHAIVQRWRRQVLLLSLGVCIQLCVPQWP